MKKVLVAAALLGLAVGNVAYAQNQPYFGVKGGLMMPDFLEIGDSAISVGGLFGMKIQDLSPSSGLRGSIAVEGEATISLIEGDLAGAEWDALTLAGYGVYRSQPINGNMYFKGKAGLAYVDISFDSTTYCAAPGFCISTDRSYDDIGISVGVGLGFKMGARNNLEIEYTIIDEVDFLSVGMNF